MDADKVSESAQARSTNFVNGASVATYKLRKGTKHAMSR